MHAFSSFRDIITGWPGGIDEFALDHDIAPKLAAVWKHRGSIPSTHWDRTVAGAGRRGISEITYELLTRLARERVPTPRPSTAAPQPEGQAAA